MEYYVIYDLNDNVVAYIDTLDELATFTNLRKKQLKYKLKNKSFIYYIFEDTYRKIYAFCWRGHNLFFCVLTLT